MTDRDALYAAICTTPDEDTPRLAFADFLVEQGGKADKVLARFIRLQVELARSGCVNPQNHPLAQEINRLEIKHAGKWSAGLNGLVLMSRFARGFVEEVTMYSKRFVAEGDRLFAAHPVRAVKFADMTGGRGVAPPVELFACPHLARLHTIHFVGQPVDDEFAGRYARSPHLAGIRCLRIGRCSLTPSGLRSLLEARSTPGLTELEVHDSPHVGSDHIVALAESRSLARLRSLSFRGCSIGAAGAVALAKSKHASKLEVLRLGHDPESGYAPLRGPGAGALAESPHLRGLRDLGLRGQELRKKGAEAFAKSYAWPGLRRLSLRGNGIPASALSAFAANPSLRTLEELDLTSNPLTAADVEPLKKAFPRTAIVTDDIVSLAGLDLLDGGEA
jgi:uncharacterized protein (TIGR02996 family)